jgi:hypothetical protein
MWWAAGATVFVGELALLFKFTDGTDKGPLERSPVVGHLAFKANSRGRDAAAPWN